MSCTASVRSAFAIVCVCVWVGVCAAHLNSISANQACKWRNFNVCGAVRVNQDTSHSLLNRQMQVWTVQHRVQIGPSAVHPRLVGGRHARRGDHGSGGDTGVWIREKRHAQFGEAAEEVGWHC